jgi:hypothetical protein
MFTQMNHIPDFEYVLMPIGINRFGNAVESKDLTLKGWGAHGELLLTDWTGVQNTQSIKQNILY